MYLYQRIFAALRRFFHRLFHPEPPGNFTLDVNMVRSIKLLARQEQRSPQELASRMINDTVQAYHAQETNRQRWQKLTPREQEVAALICMRYTTRQVAARLHISPATVKTHVEHILEKFGVPDRATMRVLLSGWDFSKWQ